MNIRIYVVSFIVMLCAPVILFAQQVDYSVVSVQEESGTEFTKITTVGDYVCMPIVNRSGSSINWLSNRILDISYEGTHIAYLSCRNNTVNIFIKDLSRQGGSVQRTNRTAIGDFSYSPDGKYICFSEQRGNENQIFQTSSDNGYVCRQMTSGNQDFSPIYSSDMKLLLFARQERMGVSIWSYNVGNNFLSSYSSGMNPCPVPGEQAFLCVRTNASGKSEIWKIDYEKGIETCIIADPDKNFTGSVEI